MPETFHALVLNLHQPTGNLQHLLAHREWEAKEILFAMDRIPRSLWDYEDVARVHLSLSGTLLETLSNGDFQHQVYGIVDCGSLLWRLQKRARGPDPRHRLLPSGAATDPPRTARSTSGDGSGSDGTCSGAVISRVSGHPRWPSPWR